MAYWCNGLKAICERDRKCIGCKAANGKGGKYVITNAERIRAMSDEELVDFFHRQIGCGIDFVPCGVVCFGKKDCPCYTTEDCKKKIANWLKEPVEEK